MHMYKLKAARTGYGGKQCESCTSNFYNVDEIVSTIWLQNNDLHGCIWRCI